MQSREGSVFSRSPVEGWSWNAAPPVPGVGIRWKEEMQSWRIHTHEQGLASVSKFFSIWNPSQSVYSVSNGKHTSTEEGFYTVCLHLEVAVVRYNKEVKKKKREADGRHILTKVRALSIFKDSIVEDLYSENYITRDSMTKEIFLWLLLCSYNTQVISCAATCCRLWLQWRK